MVKYSMQVEAASIGRWIQKAAASWNVRGIPRLLYSTRHVLLGREPRFFSLEGGIRLLLDPEDYFQCMMFYGRYTPEILQVLEHFVAPGDKVIDVGAHLGYFSIHLGRLVTRSGRVYSVEPDPRAMECLARSVAANHMEWIETFPVALSASKRSINFYLSPQLGWSTAVRNTHLVNLRTINVETVPLDWLVECGKVSPELRLVKLDVEGFEVQVLRGMQRVLQESRPILVVEVNDRMLTAQGDSPTGLLDLVRSFDYSVYAIEKRSGWWWHRRTKIGLRSISADQNCHDCDIVCIPSEGEQSVIGTGERLRLL
jgi:FkbM family methyltransferase